MDMGQVAGAAGGVAGAGSLLGFGLQVWRERRAGQEQAVKLPLSAADAQVDLAKEVNEFVRAELVHVHAEMDRVRQRAIAAEGRADHADARADQLERELRATQQRLATAERNLHLAQVRIGELEGAG